MVRVAASIREALQALSQHRAALLLGWAYDNGAWTVTRASFSHKPLLHALDLYNHTALHLTNVVAVQVGHGQPVIPSVNGYAHSLLVY